MQPLDHMRKLIACQPLFQEPEPIELQGEPLATGGLLAASELPVDLDYDPDRDFFLGATRDGRVLGTHRLDDTHILCVGGTRADKGTYFSSTLLKRKGSLVWTSTKFQDVRKLAARRGSGNRYADGMGQASYIWDGHGYFENEAIEAEIVAINPIGGVGGFVDPTKSSCVAHAKRVAKCIKPEEAGNDKDYFGKACRIFGTMGVVHIATAPDFQSRRHLGTFYDCLLEGDVQTWENMKSLDLLKEDEQGNILTTPKDVWIAGMMANPACDGIVQKLAPYFEKMCERAGEQYEGVVGELLTALGFLDDPRMRKAMSESTLDLSRIKSDPDGVSLFIPRKEGQEDIDAVPVRLIFAMCEEEMKQPIKPATGHSTLFWCDEFASMGYCDTILNGLASLAGHSAVFSFIFQTTEQCSLVYGKEGFQIFLSGCLTRVFFDIRSLEDAELIKKMAGEKEVVAVNRAASLAAGETSTHGTTSSDTTGGSKTDATSASDSSNLSKSHSYNGSLLSPFVPLFLKKRWDTSLAISMAKTIGKTLSHTVTTSHTDGSSDTEAETTTRTGTLTEQRQVRPVLAIDEIMKNYGKLRTDGRRVALVQICGVGWFETERVRYWEHEIFYRCYGWDGDHEFMHAPKPSDVIKQEYDRTPAGQGQIKREIHCKQLQLVHLSEAEDLSLLATGGVGCAALGAIAFTVLGGWLLAGVCVAGGLGANKWRVEILGRDDTMARLRAEIANLEAKVVE